MTADRFKITPGHPLPLGPSWDAEQLNLALVSTSAEAVSLVIGYQDEGLYDDIPLDPALHRTGDTWHAAVDTGGRAVRFGYRIDPHRAAEPAADTSVPIVVDPYCRTLAPRAWGVPSDAGTRPVCIAGHPAPFDWQGDRLLKTPAADTIIYELHVRGYTRHASSGVADPGTFRGIVEKIPYFQELGITAVELLPVTEWDETDNRYENPHSGEKLLNYWGYNPQSFLALRTGLAAQPADAVNEFKYLVRSLHQAGIEVILDLVFNHTGEGDGEGITSGFRAIDQALYYLLDETDGTDLNFSGCGNTVNTNHPVVSRLIVDALRYFVTEFHVDGFRFDLAAVFSRDTDGTPITGAPLVDMIAADPVLSDCKIIAEAWDAAGLYQVGTFSRNPRWREWNGKFRDDVRAFMVGHFGSTRDLATRIAGSSDLYQDDGRSPLNSINFITSHDGFTLYDLVSYNRKHNDANGELNQDGDNHNLSWNSGFEGATPARKIARLRFTRMRTFAALLLFSQGVPMICAGDEWGRTQQGNNNAWCQDNALSWLDWSLRERHAGLFRFFQKCIQMRQGSRLFRRTEFFPEVPESPPFSPAEITWQSLQPGSSDWSDTSRHLGFLLAPQEGLDDPPVFIMVNGSRSETKTFTVPQSGHQAYPTWRHIIDTAADSPADFVDAAEALRINAGDGIEIKPMALALLQAERVSQKR